MEFLRPQDLWLLALLPVVLVLLRISARHKARAREQFADFPKVARVSSVTTPRSEAVRLVFLLGALAALILALGRPRSDVELRKPVYRKQDVVLILDESLSMQATDVHPSRKERAKEEVRNFILNRGPLVDRIGLVTFSSTSVILSYLTSDAENILFYLDYMELAQDISYGTNIGTALSSALALIDKEAQVAAQAGRDDPNQKIFLLLADGEDHGEELDYAVGKTVTAGIPVYAVGIGSERDAPIPMQTPDSQYLLRDDRGALVSARFDESTLQSIAQATGGRYYRSHTGAELARVMADLLESRREVLEHETVVERVDLYPQLLAGAGILLVTLMLI
ncbi:MAG: VWA domain-containing protein [Gemmatimonadetes bacterium]|nr:VWA domain-containing protein [Gemmatimonadota bacterium]